MVWKTITNRIIGLLRSLVPKQEEAEKEKVTCEKVEVYLEALLPELNLRLVLEDAVDKASVLWIESITITAYRANKKERR